MKDKVATLLTMAATLGIGGFVSDSFAENPQRRLIDEKQPQPLKFRKARAKRNKTAKRSRKINRQR